MTSDKEENWIGCLIKSTAVRNQRHVWKDAGLKQPVFHSEVLRTWLEDIWEAWLTTDSQTKPVPQKLKGKSYEDTRHRDSNTAKSPGEESD